MPADDTGSDRFWTRGTVLWYLAGVATLAAMLLPVAWERGGLIFAASIPLCFIFAPLVSFTLLIVYYMALFAASLAWDGIKDHDYSSLFAAVWIALAILVFLLTRVGHAP